MAAERVMHPSETFFELVKVQFAPLLRAGGFKGSGRTFRRIRRECVHIVNLQTSVAGGKCAVNLALNFTFLPGVDPSAVSQEECDFRRRLSPDPTQCDFWWEFGDGADATAQSVVHLIDTYKRNGVLFFTRFGEFPGSYPEVTVDDLRARNEAKLPGGTTSSRYALFFTRMWMHLRDFDRATSFADFGLESCGPAAVSLRAQFKQLLKEIEVAGANTP